MPEDVKNTEDLTLWLHHSARGRRVDLAGRSLRPKGGYEKDVYGLDWNEHPHPHWYLPFVPAGTTLANGTVVVSPRIALVCEGPGVVLEDLTIEGAYPEVHRRAVLCNHRMRGAVPCRRSDAMVARVIAASARNDTSTRGDLIVHRTADGPGGCGRRSRRQHAGLGDPTADARNALLVQGTTSDLTLRRCALAAVGVYVWNGADATLERCTMARGLHGLYVWGRSEVSASACEVDAMEQSGFNIRDGATVTLTVRHARANVCTAAAVGLAACRDRLLCVTGLLQLRVTSWPQQVVRVGPTRLQRKQVPSWPDCARRQKPQSTALL